MTQTLWSCLLWPVTPSIPFLLKDLLPLGPWLSPHLTPTLVTSLWSNLRCIEQSGGTWPSVRGFATWGVVVETRRNREERLMVQVQL